MPKQLSRAKRCAAAVAPLYDLASKLENFDPRNSDGTGLPSEEEIRPVIDEAESQANNARGELEMLQEELQSWYDNLNEGLQQTGTGEALTEAIDQLQSAMDECDDAERLASQFDYSDYTDDDWDTFDVAIQEIADQLEQAAQTAEETMFPGMFGR